MGYKIEGEKCPVCKAYLFNEDDVVFCPICGAPHHRDCYAALGHCGLQELHGTSEQYSPKREEEPAASEAEQKENIGEKCPRCGRDKIENSLFCPYCGHDFAGNTNTPNGGHAHGAHVVYPPFIDPYGGVPHDGSVSIEGESVEDVRKFVFSNTQRYIPLFCKLDKKHKFSWNWAAFLFPHLWLFFRKHYVAGAVALALTLLSAFCLLPLSADVATLIGAGGQIVQNNQEQLNLILSVIPQVPLSSFLFAAAGWIIGLFTSVYFGLMGDWHYRNYVVSSIKQIRTSDDAEDRDAAFFKKGATSLMGFLIAYFITQLLPQIVALFI